MFNRFQHFLSYGSTDQQTVRELSEYFDGLIVPGTIAAFQAEGTKGFVLTLSARSNDPYVIDSRFPLFQNRLPSPKKSHLMLADVMGVPTLVNRHATPRPTDFDDEMVQTIARAWVDFNVGFESVQMKTFDKYASRLKEQVLPQDRQDPAFVLPPYTMVGEISDGWAEVSESLWAASCQYADTKGVRSKLRRVVAASSSTVWNELASAVDDEEVVAWVSGLDEFKVNSEAELIAYGQALQNSQSRDQSVFALYGGFLSVLLSRHGLNGSSHGIGFGEHRDWVELPSSGAPPARYYVPKLHRYIGVDVAEILWRQFPELIACSCGECEGGSPSALDYHGLMKHSVRARAAEIEMWLNMPTAAVVDQLTTDSQSFKSAISRLSAPSKVIRRAEDSYTHLGMWARVMTVLD
ncbi:hypothetical protein [Arthrobacter cryoconiti]|uniref:Uncharacterized protein n=1 Tax=Arthrobacter cryoconiti TaxID=748907 RepID=A0ABV8R384_9MICC|nr:hypothetical protein [Arthrobacter cryoconiti]MCC9068566.1 hypothetical protein [Arthrobacter cryoconiti]